MTATVHRILRRRRSPDVAVVDVADFRLSPGAPVEERRLLDDPDLSLYCFDLKARTALFVATPPEVDLTARPFLYQAQFALATEAVTVPLDLLARLAERATKPRRLAFLYGVGRCGSTLLQRMLRHLPGVTSVSEPDALTQLTELAFADGSGDDEISRLAALAMPFFVRRPMDCLVVKPRSFTFELAPQLRAAFPAARALFMYRDAEAVVASFLQLWDGRVGLRVPRSGWLLRPWTYLLPPAVRRSIDRAVPLFRDVPIHRWLEAGLPGVFLAHWQSLVRTYLRLAETGAPLRALDYGDLLAAPEAVLAELAAFLGVPGPVPAEALATLDEDSQQGTRLARDGRAPRLSAKEAAALHRLMERIPGLFPPDGRLPGSLGPSRRRLDGSALPAA
jgi:hypothetical protein